MTGGFKDLRPLKYRSHEGAADSTYGTSVSSSSLTTSSKCLDVHIKPKATKQNCRFFRVSRKGIDAAMGHLSPQSEQQKQADKVREAVTPLHPMKATIYGRAISASSLQTLVPPLEPSFTALRIEARLQDREYIRTMLHLLVCEINLQKEVDNSSLANGTEHGNELLECDYCAQEADAYATKNIIHQENMGEDFVPTDSSSYCTIPTNLQNSVMSVYDRTQMPEASEESFQEELLVKALHLDSSLMSPEELVTKAVTEARNPHVLCDYIMLETGPSSESAFA